MGREDSTKEDKRGTNEKFKKRVKDRERAVNRKKNNREISEARDLSNDLLKLKEYINNHYHSS